MFLGMPFHFWIVLVFSLYLLWLFRIKPAPKPTEPPKAEFFGGPLDGKNLNVPELFPYFIQQYMPEDPDEAQQIGEIGGQKLYAPSYAYYTQITDNQYIYKRDVKPDEIESIISAGGLIEEN